MDDSQPDAQASNVINDAPGVFTAEDIKRGKGTQRNAATWHCSPDAQASNVINDAPGVFTAEDAALGVHTAKGPSDSLRFQ